MKKLTIENIQDIQDRWITPYHYIRIVQIQNSEYQIGIYEGSLSKPTKESVLIIKREMPMYNTVRLIKDDGSPYDVTIQCLKTKQSFIRELGFIYK